MDSVALRVMAENKAISCHFEAAYYGAIGTGQASQAMAWPVLAKVAS